MADHELRIEGLHARVAGREILTGIDLTIRSGEVHAIMGPNGSGKSTLSHVLMGKPGYEVTGGRVLLDGVDLLGLPTWKRAQAGLFLAMQYPIEVPGVSLVDMLEQSIRNRRGRPVAAPPGRNRSRRERQPELVGAVIAREAERIGFDERLVHRQLNVDLSGGEKKRNETVQLAVLRPRIAVLDELDSGLDVDALRAVARRIEAATNEDGLGVLAITHYSRLLGELKPDIVHVMARGRIRQTGGPELADELERTGYAGYGEEAAAEVVTPEAAADPFADPLA